MSAMRSYSVVVPVTEILRTHKYMITSFVGVPTHSLLKADDILVFSSDINTSPLNAALDLERRLILHK